jgi:hypothetical protein
VTNLEQAISTLEAELTELGWGTNVEEGTADWWLLRGKATGLSLLRQFTARDLINPKDADKHRKKALKAMKLMEIVE